ncbi:class-II DAHP synthase [Fragilaria crotonensis]|nr:class-II DAHP synthase [Fragilaria crotonensis]
MTYSARGRSLTEVIIAVVFVGFLTGFVVVLCIGNYHRAKRAMERQKQRRLARLAGRHGSGVVMPDSTPPRSFASGSSAEYSDEKASLLKRTPDDRVIGGMSRRTNYPPSISDDLLLHVEN